MLEPAEFDANAVALQPQLTNEFGELASLLRYRPSSGDMAVSGSDRMFSEFRSTSQ